ncbi:hypothetical protein CHI12_11050 [Terribacillus saccharophilus]|uniref:Peptidase G2 n=2 Tax=Terribacillus saccharophilus TaxID=361277 RepID=A0A268HC50_9BACI|nr:hypothetical protein CHI12_11050 [Terribacillus saccharophilus]
MTKYKSYLDLNKFEQSDMELNEPIMDNFQKIDSKLGSALQKDSKQYTNLVERFEDIETLVETNTKYNVRDYGAKGDGVTNDTKAFKDAIGTGKRTVLVPAGTYVVDEVKLPDNTYFIGEGIGLTVIISSTTASVNNTVVSNADWKNGNTNVLIKGMTVDWNKKGARLDAPYPGRPEGCAVALVGARDSYIREVFAKDGKIHSFEVTAPRGSENTVRAKRIWISNCIATGGGDDNFTTHYCDHVYIENCYSFDPMGTFGNTSNTNCFEIDDGSVNVHITNCLAVGGVRGYEIKAHASAPAGMNSSLTNCTAINNVLGINIRHIGHHLDSNPTSTSAWDVSIQNCFIYDPKRNAGLYDAVTVRAMEVSAYRNVNISNLHVINTGGSEIEAGEAVMEFRFKSENINVNNLTVRNFTKQSYDVMVVGGENSRGRVNFSNISLWQSAESGVFTGTGVNNCNFIGGQLVKSGGKYGFDMYEQGNTMLGFQWYGYDIPARISHKNYEHIPNRLRHGLLAGTSNGHPLNSVSAILACTSGSEATGSKSVVISSVGGKASGDRSAVINSSRSEATANSATVLNAYNTINPTSDSIAGGFGSSPSSSNRKWDINSSNGNIKAAGTVSSGSSFSDYAEYFESLDGKAIPTGTIVTLDKDKIRPAREGEDMLGVISETAGIVLGEAPFTWANRYETNDFGGYIYEEVEVTEEEVNEVTGEITQKTRMVTLPKENPEYDPEKVQISRADRPEWNIVGLVGQVYVRTDETIEAGDYIEAEEGTATKSEYAGQGWKVMKVTKPYETEKGYGVAKVMIK